MANHPWEDFFGLSDLEITIGDKKLHCHKMTLAQRSPVFQKMFDINMKENLENKLTIEEIDETTFLDFLHYLYEPDRVMDVLELTMDLFRVAIKYLVSSLIEVFHKQFAVVVKKENVIELAILLSETGINEEFLTKTMDYIFLNFNDMKKYPNYMQLISIPVLAAAFFDKFTARTFTSGRFCYTCQRYY